tara:strand:- start:184 stop:1044 length:861 start_codon:yes stop_codon:yes gene_type:complete
MIERKVDLSGKTTYQFGGYSEYYLDFNEDKEEILQECSSLTDNIYILGNGSNVAFSDRGYPGLVIKSSKTGIRNLTKNSIEVFSGTPMPEISRYCLDKSFSGAEFMIGIPGTIGGGLAMNAGSYGNSVFESGIVSKIYSYNFKNNSISITDPKDLNYGYRLVEGLGDDFIYKVELTFNSDDPKLIKEKHKEYLLHRKETQPSGKYNAGSVFKNPPGNYAGKLIENAGLKGYRVGTVSISEKHANFFIAEKNAKSTDLYNLVQHVKNIIEENFSVSLEEEIRFVGDF